MDHVVACQQISGLTAAQGERAKTTENQVRSITGIVKDIREDFNEWLVKRGFGVETKYADLKAYLTELKGEVSPFCHTNMETR